MARQYPFGLAKLSEDMPQVNRDESLDPTAQKKPHRSPLLAPRFDPIEREARADYHREEADDSEEHDSS